MIRAGSVPDPRWERGRGTVLPIPGDQVLAYDINNRGQVVGFSDLPNDNNGASPNFHAFLWTSRHGMQDLGTLPGGSASAGFE